MLANVPSNPCESNHLPVSIIILVDGLCWPINWVPFIFISINFGSDLDKTNELLVYVFFSIGIWLVAVFWSSSAFLFCFFWKFPFFGTCACLNFPSRRHRCVSHFNWFSFQWLTRVSSYTLFSKSVSSFLYNFIIQRPAIHCINGFPPTNCRYFLHLLILFL